MANFTGMPYEFWLRIQNKFDDSNKVHSIKQVNSDEIDGQL